MIYYFNPTVRIPTTVDMISKFHSLLGPNPPPLWVWGLYIPVVIFLALHIADRNQPKDRCYSADEMEDLLPGLFHPEKGPIVNPMELYIDSGTDLFIAEAEFSEGQRWYVFTPVTRGIWKVYNTRWLKFVTLCSTAIILPIYLMVHYLQNKTLMNEAVCMLYDMGRTFLLYGAPVRNQVPI
jgi:hypothetical protein